MVNRQEIDRQEEENRQNIQRVNEDDGFFYTENNEECTGEESTKTTEYIDLIQEYDIDELISFWTRYYKTAV